MLYYYYIIGPLIIMVKNEKILHNVSVGSRYSFLSFFSNIFIYFNCFCSIINLKRYVSFRCTQNESIIYTCIHFFLDYFRFFPFTVY